LAVIAFELFDDTEEGFIGLEAGEDLVSILCGTEIAQAMGNPASFL